MSGLVKNRRDAWLAGVIAGLADNFGWSRFWMRVIFLCAMLVEPFSLTLVYVVMAILMPAPAAHRYYRRR
ncbi:PspC domain-containing protein [Paraferrimonas sedimenticola]|uniref:Phage shock protein PspC N-terminal domain-containing protein n=1 Tax=Paraferrimonas sedimenticola TaxID=375674 RepID=A0AA37RWW4_9GAMM|nr:PspC domain-containing protein [Paraferrimonas sedimenticola]GLP97235.1 hypothetical protein GCM10007895_25420 [Paraferrimonas sedimenticola]